MLEKVFTIFFLLVSVALGKTLPDGTVQTHRQKISIDNTKVNATLTNFPALVTEANLNSTFLSECQSDGDDIRFTSDEAGDTQLAQDIETYTTNGAEVDVHVKVPSVSSSVDTDIWAWCGDASATAPARSSTYGAENVWDTNYKGVWHLHEGDNTAANFYKDMTSNVNHGTLTDANGNSAAAAGQVNGAFDFNGDADYIEIAATTLGIASAYTFHAWIKTPANPVGDYAIVGKDNSDVVRDFQFRVNIDGTLQFIRFDISNVVLANFSSVATVDDDLFHYVVAVFSNSSGSTIYIDGTSDATNANTTNNNDSNNIFRIGDRTTGFNHDYFDGIIDEVRISNVARSVDWIKAEYNNQNSPSTFWIAGATEQLLKRRFLIGMK